MAKELPGRFEGAPSALPPAQIDGQVLDHVHRPPTNGGAAGPPSDDWRRLVAAVRHRKWMVLCATVVGLVLGAWGAHLLDPQYLARAVLWVEVPDPRDRTPDPLGAGGLLGATGWVDLLRSHAVLDEVVRAQRLYLSPESSPTAAFWRTFRVESPYRPGRYRLVVDKGGAAWRLETDGDSVMDRGAVGDSIGSRLGFAWTPGELPRGGATLAFAVASPYEAARSLAKDLRVVTELGGNFIRLELKGVDPTETAAIINAVAERFVQVATDLKRQKQHELARIFGEQLEHARQQLSRAEAALRGFRVSAAAHLGDGAATGGGGRPWPDPALASFVELRSEQDQLRLDRGAIERVLSATADSSVFVDALGLIGAVQRSPELSLALRDLMTREAEVRVLRYRYTDDNPEVRRVATQVAGLRRTTIPTLARALVAELTTREREMSQRVQAVSGDLRRLPTLVIEDARLRRDVETAEEVFQRIQQRHGEAQLAEVSSLSDVRVLDAAAPPEVPLGDVGVLILLLGVMGGLGAGMLGAVALERFDGTVHSPGQVTGDFGLRILGALPHVRRQGAGATQAMDSLRGIRLNLMHTYGTAGPIVLTISSPSSSDGKSFVTSNLALAFADAGFHTLLVDGDLRRGALHRMFNAARKPGLTDLLAGGLSVDTVIQATSHSGLSFMASGSRTRTGPELLSSSAMTQLLVALRARYGVILFDSPPLAAGVEPYVLGTFTGNLLLVLRLGMTDRDLAEAKLDALDRLPIRVLGAVLNDVRSAETYGRYSYALAGYELHDEETDWADRKILRAPR